MHCLRSRKTARRDSLTPTKRHAMNQPALHPSLYEQAIENEQARHAARMADLECMRKMFARLEALRRVIKDRGYTLAPDDITLDTGRRDVFIRENVNDLGCTRLHAALIAVGFVEVKRVDYSTWSSVVLSRPGIRVRIETMAPASAAKAAA